MSTILQELETTIAGLKTTTAKSNTGIVREAGDGVAKIEGLSDVMLNEMIEFPGGLYGLALNLEETEVGCILLGDYTKVTEGTEARTTGRLLSVPVGKVLLGRVVSALGEPLDGKGGRDAVHDDRLRGRVRQRDQSISRAVRRRGDGRMVHGQRHGRAHRVRRSLEARRRVSPGLARAQAPVGPRGVSRRRVLSAL